MQASERTGGEQPIEDPGSECADPGWKGAVSGLVVAGAFLLVLELSFGGAFASLEVMEFAAVSYLAAVVAMTMGLWLAHALPVWGVIRLVEKVWDRREYIVAILAAVFGLSWQQTVVQGDGIGAHPLFPYIRVGFLIGVPLCCAVVAWVFVTPKIPRQIRMVAAGVFVVVAAVFNMTVLVDYQPFHGHLAAYNAAVFAGLTYSLWTHPMFQRAAVAVGVIAAVAAALVVPKQYEARTHVQSFAHVPASLSAGLPGGALVRVEPDRIFDVERAAYQDLAEYWDVFYEQDDKFEAAEPKGHNVMVVVLESVRADYWDDPELTPQFHDWKSEGLYAPYSVANYPATPLAYGAMFAAQPPSVLAQTPYWGENRLFDKIRGEFDELILSRPDISWFEHTAITDFFLPRDESVNAHEEAPDGLAYKRERLEELDEEESFFSWIHLYEPHDPYEAREPWAEEGADDHEAYRSEIAFVDKHLGEFMHWFFDQPFADDTLLVVVSDHGQGMGEEILGESFWGHHVHVHNVVSSIPMFFAGPGLPDDQRDASFQTMQMDVMPSIYDFLGEPMPRRLKPQGNSVYWLHENRPVRPLTTEAFSIRGHQFFEFVAGTQQGDDLEELRREFHRISTDGHGYSPKIGLQHGEHKLIYDRLLNTYWLYDVGEDPQEQYDLYHEEPQKAEMMVERLQQWKTLQGEVVRRLDEVMK